MTALSTTRYPRVWATGVGIAALSFGAEQVMPALWPKRPTGFTYRTSTNPDSRELVYGAHGMQGDSTQLQQFAPAAFDLIGDSVYSAAGSDFRRVSPDAMSYLRRKALDDRIILPVGVSAGGLVIINWLRAARKARLRVSGVIFVSSPFGPQDPIWPNEAFHHGSLVLHGGPYSYLLWLSMNCKELVSIRKRYGMTTTQMVALLWRPDPTHPAHTEMREICRRIKKIPASNITSTAAMLRRGARLLPDEFADLECLAFEREGDGRVRHNFTLLQQAFPRARRVFIPVAGHANFDGCAELYTDAINQWREDTRHARRSFAL